jgi:imidazolonepropionase-like amidohydrolase
VNVPDQTIEVEDRKITAITTGRTAREAVEGEETIDLGGAFVVPGLIDMHVHIGYRPDEVFPKVTIGQATAGMRAARNLQTAAFAGITTVRDLGTARPAVFEAKAAWHRGEIPGARPLVAGPIVATASGVESVDPALFIGVSGVEETRRVVRELIAQGADVIKLYADDTRVQLSLEEMRTAADEAHTCGVSVAAHVSLSTSSLRRAIDVGCDSVEHCLIDDLELLEEMAARGIAMCPTMAVLNAFLEVDNYRNSSPPSNYERQVGPINAHPQRIKTAFDLGVKIIAGTDAGFVPFDALIGEVIGLGQCGLCPSAALAAATINAASVLRRDDLGEIAVGRVADLLVLSRDPLADLRALTRKRTVILGGEVFWPSSGECSAGLRDGGPAG